ncbi:MAG: peptide chain release factor N(5)-glutamine methyltransferase [Betaproteobacteria bacterium]
MSNQQTLGAVLRGDAQALAAVSGIGFDAAARAVDRIARHTLGLSPAQRILREADRASAFDLTGYALALDRVRTGVPIAYVIGEEAFRNHLFRVTPEVLIPRPDTEVLVDRALATLPADRPVRVADLGTGSGCVGISIALERPAASVVCVDSSPAALAVARDNAGRLGAGNARFVESDWYGGLANLRFDLIVSNPPYIAQSDAHLAQLAHEPRGALVGGADGLDAIRLIVAEAGAHLQTGGTLLVEHGYDQRDAVAALFRVAGFRDVAGYDDLGGRARVMSGHYA